jgi:hypothetical protein
MSFWIENVDLRAGQSGTQRAVAHNKFLRLPADARKSEGAPTTADGGRSLSILPVHAKTHRDFSAPVVRHKTPKDHRQTQLLTKEDRRSHYRQHHHVRKLRDDMANQPSGKAAVRPEKLRSVRDKRAAQAAASYYLHEVTPPPPPSETVINMDFTLSVEYYTTGTTFSTRCASGEVYR